MLSKFVSDWNIIVRFYHKYKAALICIITYISCKRYHENNTMSNELLFENEAVTLKRMKKSLSPRMENTTLETITSRIHRINYFSNQLRHVHFLRQFLGILILVPLNLT